MVFAISMDLYIMYNVYRIFLIHSFIFQNYESLSILINVSILLHNIIREIKNFQRNVSFSL